MTSIRPTNQSNSASASNKKDPNTDNSSIDSSNTRNAFMQLNAQKDTMRIGNDQLIALNAMDNSQKQSGLSNYFNQAADASHAYGLDLKLSAKNDIKQAKVSPPDIARELIKLAKNKIQQYLQQLQIVMQSRKNSKNAKKLSDKDMELSSRLRTNTDMNQASANLGQQNQNKKEIGT